MIGQVREERDARTGIEGSDDARRPLRGESLNRNEGEWILVPSALPLASYYCTRQKMVREPAHFVEHLICGEPLALVHERQEFV